MVQNYCDLAKFTLFTSYYIITETPVAQYKVLLSILLI